MVTARGDSGAGDPAGSEEIADLFRAIGRMIKAARERASMSQRELGQAVGYSEEQISSIERGRRTPQPDFLVAVDELLKCGGLLALLVEDVERAKARRRVRHPEWFRDYAALERDAVEINFYNNHDVPGLLQTERRTRALYDMRKPLLDEETIENRVASRMSRQEILTSWPPPMITAVIEETVLRRPLGGLEVHKEQLEQLLHCGRLRNMELQVMPTDRSEHAGMGGAFVLLTPKGKTQLGYTEAQSSSRLIADPEEVRILAARYGSIRAQALTMRESLALIENILKER
ncbi:helix-turn-helix domain-containing protein [Streptomyces sp. PA5.6]|uniref:helix-turn-helix domain-containing protein n=1 Tax=Streptomyces sp. PA5.6 TaxID=3035651 RepID=UPI0039048E35